MKETVESVVGMKNKSGDRAGELEERIRTLELALQETHERYRQALSDLDNYRRRMAKQQSAIEKSAKKAILLPLLEVTDSIERAFAHKAVQGEASEKWIHGIHSQLLDILRRNRVYRIEAVGQGFDPRFHDAVEMITSDGLLSGRISREFRRGYLIDDEVLRPARVQVVE